MAYVVVARLRAKPGLDDRLRETLLQVSEPSRAEPGNLVYQAHQSTEDPRWFVVYEQYVDEAAYHAHAASEHFARHIARYAVPELIEEREVSYFEPLDGPRPVIA